MATQTQLIFVYNADSGIFNSVVDSMKKLADPGSYECNLCRVTHGVVKMRNPWREYLESLPYEKIFLHRDELANQYPSKTDLELPAILIKRGSDFSILLSAREIEEITTIGDLKEKMESALQELRGRG